MNLVIFKFSNGGQSYREFVVRKVGHHVKVGLKFGMVGTYTFETKKKEGKVTF